MKPWVACAAVAGVAAAAWYLSRQKCKGVIVGCITEINRFPIKSCGGESLAEAVLDRYGMVGDRKCMVIDSKGDFQTQRQIPRLCLIKVTWQNSGALQLEAPGQRTLSATVPEKAAPRKARLWDETIQVVDAGDEAAQWLSTFLGQELRLVGMGQSYDRELVEKEYVPFGSDASCNLADGYPILLISEASLEDLNRRMSTPLPMARFRPNLVVKGCRPFEEDEWTRIRIGIVLNPPVLIPLPGKVEYDVVKPCGRCKLPTVDQVTAVMGTEPSATLRTFRQIDQKGHKLNGSVIFGQNLIPRSYGGKVAVGDKVEVLSRGAETYTFKSG